MLKIIPIPAFEDNYIWTLAAMQKTICIDPGASAPVLDYLRQTHSSLEAILVTHHHSDHINGIPALHAAFPDCPVYGPEGIDCITHPVAEHDIITTPLGDFQVWSIPGHTRYHLGYRLDGHFFCGDTLFSAGCGLVFPDGNVDELCRSIQKINTLPADTLLYPAHEYTRSNLLFAQSVDSENSEIQKALMRSERQTCTLPTSLTLERQINPFIKVTNADFTQHLKEISGLPAKSVYDWFRALREAKNHFSS